ncbi:MAG: hypothetical protein RR314_04695 [Oscillospiraceae bacterium]
MAYTTDDIKARALALMGGDAGTDGARISALCSAAASELERRLRAGVVAAELGETFVTAAGILALSMYAELQGADGAESVRAGSVTVSRRGAGAEKTSAAVLRREAEGMLSAFLEDRGFDFRGVRG